MEGDANRRRSQEDPFNDAREDVNRILIVRPAYTTQGLWFPLIHSDNKREITYGDNIDGTTIESLVKRAKEAEQDDWSNT